MIRPEIDLVGQREFGGRNAEPVGLRGALEDLISPRVLNFEGEAARGDGVSVGAIERQRAGVDRLAGLVDRLFGREEDAHFLLNPDWLSNFPGSERGVRDIVNLLTSEEAGRQPKP